MTIWGVELSQHILAAAWISAFMALQCLRNELWANGLSGLVRKASH